ncbi:hypothetical protein HYN57_13645 [Vibrio parahaemolyticus]|jgi:hypothetical protein|nr:hypothetical protein [Vibrio parahaemolyticus]MCF9038170.1 hypothetical protein [Vibrio parahaemolyticus]MCF9963169.1 hypothetical protein [Vibrio parahaemolyticus]
MSYKKMEHYETIIIKGLLGGGSTNETFSSRLIQGTGIEKVESVSEMWAYLEGELQQKVIDVIESVFCEEIDTNNLIKGLVKHVAQRGALAEYYALDLSERSQFTEDEEREKIMELFEAKKKIWEEKEKTFNAHDYYNAEPEPDCVTCRECRTDFYDYTSDARSIWDTGACLRCYIKGEVQ